MTKQLTIEMVEDAFSVSVVQHSGALELTALCLDAFGHGSFYKTKTYYGYELNEAKLAFAQDLLEDESVVFVFGIKEWHGDEVLYDGCES